VIPRAAWSFNNKTVVRYEYKTKKKLGYAAIAESGIAKY
jgi:hypothetical protein